MKRRDFVKSLGAAGGLAALAWREASGLEHAGVTESRAPRDSSNEIASDDDDSSEARLAWRELVEALRGAEASFLDSKQGPFDDGELAYAYRNLTHVLTFATQLYMYGDPESPTFIRVQEAPFEKTLGGHPDVIYHFAPVQGDRRYRIRGRRGDEAYLSFTIHRGRRGSGFDQFFASHLNHHDLETDADGNFEIGISRKRSGKNWLALPPDATEVYSRIYRHDPARDRPAHFAIESIDSPLPRRFGRADVALRLRQMTQIVRDMGMAIPQPLSDPNRIGRMWQIERQDPSQMWQALDNIYCRGSFALESNQVLILEGIAVPCDYWGIQLWNPFLGSGDRRLGPITINDAQAHLGQDRAFRVAIARENPRVPGLDWISTAGERRGTFFVRWMRPDTKPPTPTCRVTTLAELRKRSRGSS